MSPEPVSHMDSRQCPQRGGPPLYSLYTWLHMAWPRLSPSPSLNSGWRSRDLGVESPSVFLSPQTPAPQSAKDFLYLHHREHPDKDWLRPFGSWTSNLQGTLRRRIFYNSSTCHTFIQSLILHILLCTGYTVSFFWNSLRAILSHYFTISFFLKLLLIIENHTAYIVAFIFSIYCSIHFILFSIC